MAKPFILPGRTRTGNAVRPPQPAKPVGLAAHVTLPGEAQRLAGPSRKMEERMVLSDALTLIRKGFDQAATDLEEGRGNVALCRDGCGKCCITNTPFANGLEAQHAVTTMGVSTEAIQRARDWLTHKHPQATIYPRSQPAVLYGVPAAEFTPAEVEQLEAEVLALAGTPCPFLGADMRCMVYDQRPLACRAYGVTVTPDTFCERPTDANEELRPGDFSYNGPAGERLDQTANMLQQAAGNHHVGLGAGGFWPTVLFATFAPAEFQQMIQRGEIAQAKLAVMPAQVGYPGPLSQRSRDTYNAFLASRRGQTAAPPAAVATV